MLTCCVVIVILQACGLMGGKLGWALAPQTSSSHHGEEDLWEMNCDERDFWIRPRKRTDSTRIASYHNLRADPSRSLAEWHRASVNLHQANLLLLLLPFCHVGAELGQLV